VVVVVVAAAAYFDVVCLLQKFCYWCSRFLGWDMSALAYIDLIPLCHYRMTLSVAKHQKYAKYVNSRTSYNILSGTRHLT
jgi:hypothetical protein